MLEIALILFLVTCVLVGFALYRSSTGYVIEQRLDKIKQAEIVPTPEEELGRPFVQRILLPFAESLASLFRRYTPKKITERTHNRLVMAGLYPRVTTGQMMGLCWISAGVFAALMFALAVPQRGQPDQTLTNILYVVLGTLCGYTVPQFFLSRRVRERQEAILLDLPYAIDMLSISVEAGMGFDSAIGYTMRKFKGPLADEFAKTLNEIRLGKPRLDALEELGARAGVDELRTFVTAIVHSSRLGGSVANTLRVQAVSIRVRRRQRAQEQAMKAPVKMIFPLVFFIFPVLFIVILGPAGIRIWKELFPQ